MQYEELFNLLREKGLKPRKTARGIMCLCPAHDDHSPSLSIRIEGGRIIPHCFAGCSKESVLAALGITQHGKLTKPLSNTKKEDIPKEIQYRAEELICFIRNALAHAPTEVIFDEPLSTAVDKVDYLEYLLDEAIATRDKRTIVLLEKLVRELSDLLYFPPLKKREVQNYAAN